MDLLNRRKNDSKKEKSVAAIEITAGDLKAGVVSAMCILPPRCIVTAIYGVTETAHDGGGFLVESAPPTPLIGIPPPPPISVTSAQAAVGVEASVLAAPVLVDAQMKLNITATTDVTQGSTFIIIEFLEYTLSEGTLLAVS